MPKLYLMQSLLSKKSIPMPGKDPNPVPESLRDLLM